MGLKDLYESKWGEKVAAATKKADEAPAAVAEAPAAEAKVETTEVAAETETPITDAELDAELGKLTEEQMQDLAKEVASKQKEAAAEQQAALQKEAEELFAAGQIFGQGFLATVNGTEKVAEKAAATAPKSAIEKFAGFLNKELAKKS